MKLSEFKGKYGKITTLPRNDKVAGRLIAMGYFEGIRVDFVLSASGLCEYRVGETLLALRINECDKILVQGCDNYCLK